MATWTLTQEKAARIAADVALGKRIDLLAAKLAALEVTVGNLTVVMGPPAIIDCSGTLQSRIDAAASGSTLDLTGCAYTAGANVNKPLTLIGAQVTVGAGLPGITVSANDVTLRNLTVIGGSSTVYNDLSACITSRSTAVQRLSVIDCTLRNASYGVYAWTGNVDLLVQGCTIEDIKYTGVMVLSGTRGIIETCAVRRIGVGNQIGDPGIENNAYGIAISNLGGQAISRDTIIRDNVVEDVPTWHALDTHGGDGQQWLRNIVRRSSRALFLTSSPSDQLVDGNQFLTPSPVTFNLEAITLASVTNVTFTNNIKTGWGNSYLSYDYGGGSTGIVGAAGTHGNVVTP